MGGVNGPTQTERVVKAARSYRGVCQADFLGPDTIDGGRPITRLAARIFDAERQGFTFEIITRRKGFKVYRLITDGAERDAAPPPPGNGTVLSPPGCVSLSTDEPTLFDVRPASTSHYDEAA